MKLITLKMNWRNLSPHRVCSRVARSTRPIPSDEHYRAHCLGLPAWCIGTRHNHVVQESLPRLASNFQNIFVSLTALVRSDQAIRWRQTTRMPLPPSDSQWGPCRKTGGTWRSQMRRWPVQPEWAYFFACKSELRAFVRGKTRLTCGLSTLFSVAVMVWYTELAKIIGLRCKAYKFVSGKLSSIFITSLTALARVHAWS